MKTRRFALAKNARQVSQKTQTELSGVSIVRFVL